MNKAFNSFIWENEPSHNSPLNADNLNKINNAIDIIDSRVVTHEATKANQADLLTTVADVTFDESTGIFTFVKMNGSTIQVNTKLEKLILNWRFDEITQTLYLILEDGTEMPIDLSSLIAQIEFVDSDTIAFIMESDGKVKATIVKGSITGDYLDPDYLSQILIEVGNARTSADNASKSEANALNSANEAKTAKTEAKQYAESANSAKDYIDKKLELATFDIDDEGNLIYTDNTSYIFAVDDNGNLTWEVT